MKKIVALVLAMVMVLGLATTAFAAGAVANKYTLEGVTGYENFTASLKEVDKAEDENFAVYEVVLKAKKAFTDGSGEEFKKGEETELVFGGVDEFVIVASPASALFALVDGKNTTYLADAEVFEDGWAEKASLIQMEYVANPGKWDCNAYYAKTDAMGGNMFYLYDGAFYKEVAVDSASDITDAYYVFNVGGMAVVAEEAVEIDYMAEQRATDTDLDPYALDGDYFFNAHNYQATYKYATNDPEVEAVYCLCDGVNKTQFKFVETGSFQVAKGVFGDAAYNPFDAVWVEKVAPTNYKVLIGAGAGAATGDAAPADKDDAVTSPKTFDAGIAMYVGMSVMAAAGSAVVLKKKD